MQDASDLTPIIAVNTWQVCGEGGTPIVPGYPKLSECTALAQSHTARKQQGSRTLRLISGHTVVNALVNQSVRTGRIPNWVMEYITKYYTPEKLWKRIPALTSVWFEG